MCAIIDNNVAAEAFGDNQTAAGRAFREAVVARKLRLFVGGELLDELDQNSKFERGGTPQCNMARSSWRSATRLSQ